MGTALWPPFLLHRGSLFNLLNHLTFGRLALLWGNRGGHCADPPPLLVNLLGFLQVYHLSMSLSSRAVLHYRDSLFITSGLFKGRCAEPVLPRYARQHRLSTTTVEK